jgi:aerobic carbon-monoxide dehydrogenase small subunit
MIEIKLSVNGKQRSAMCEPDTPLLDFLRDTLDCKDVKVCCNTGECGACTIILDGVPVNSCVMLAAGAGGGEIVTAEGVANGGKLHPVQEALIETAGSQCGYCTPGFVISAKALLDRNPEPSVEEIKEAIAGNICRCTGYTKIIEAIRLAAGRCREAQS